MFPIRSKKNFRAESVLTRIKSRPHKKRWFWICIFMFLFLTLFVLLFVLYTFSFYADGLISRERLVNRQFRGLMMYDRNNEVIYESEVQNLTGNVAIEEIPTILQQATIAIEDKDFNRHIGFSLPAMIRAFFANAESGEIVQGASTITQQLVKNALLGDTSTRYTRKMREVILAFALEYRYSKSELLELYLNSIYYGRGAWGVGDAAEIYFNKKVQDLSPTESTYLAGLPQAPSVYGFDMEKARARQIMVVKAMTQQEIVTEQLANEWLNIPLSLTEYKAFSVKYPFYTLAVRQNLIELFGLEGLSEQDALEQLVNRGLVVYTNFDPRSQDIAEKAVSDGVNLLKSRNVSNGAAMVMDSATGAVRAMVGSKDWFDDLSEGKVNVLYTMQQPGSTLKPLIYAAALQEGAITPNVIFQDVRKNYGGGYVPVNYDGRYRGAVSLRRALANSLNVPAVEALNRLGIDNGVAYLIKMGMRSLELKAQDISSKDQVNYSQYYGLSLALGGYEVMPAEVVGAFGVLARGGVYQQPNLVNKVVDRFGNTVYTHQQSGSRVIDTRYAELVTDILADNDARRETFGTRASNLEVPGKRVAVKTGTTTDYRDSWAVGYDSRYTVGVWVGNNDNSAMQEVAGSVGGASVWKQIMQQL